MFTNNVKNKKLQRAFEVDHLGVKRVTAALLLISIFVGCFAAQLYQQKSFKFSYSETPTRQLQVYSGITILNAITIDKTCMLAFPISFTVGCSNVGQPPSTNSTRIQIANYINANPGIQFRGICAGLCLPVGLVQYHLGVLLKSGLVSFIRDGRYKRFFAAKKFCKTEMKTISVLRHKTAKKIVETLLIKKQLSHGKLAFEVSISSPALTWQMKTLTKLDFMLQVNDGLKTLYSLDEASTPQLKAYLSMIK